MTGLRHRHVALHQGQTGAQGIENGRKRGVEDHSLRISVVEEVEQLLGAIAVVDVEWREPTLERGVVGLEVFGPVVEIGCDLGLLGQARGDEVGGQSVRVAVKRAPGDDTLALDDGGMIRLDGRDRFVDISIGEIPSHTHLPNLVR
jgi:hypothetical protein